MRSAVTVRAAGKKRPSFLQVKSPLSPLVLVARTGPCRPGVLAWRLHAAHVLGN